MKATSIRVKIRKFSCENGIVKFWLVKGREEECLIIGADQLFELAKEKEAEG